MYYDGYGMQDGEDGMHSPALPMGMNRKSGGWDNLLDKTQDALGLAGFLPGVGFFSDMANAGISLMRGRPGEAAVNALFALPGWGDIAAAGDKARKIGGRIAGRF